MKINPKTAEELCIKDAEEITIETLRGSMEAKAWLREDIDPRVVQVPSHWAGKSNVNFLTDNVNCAPIIGSAQLRCQLCRIKKGGGTLTKKLLLIDIDKCVGCFACEVACKQENKLPLAARHCLVTRIGPRKIQDEISMEFVPGLCLQCDDPICAYFCSFDAIIKREDGIVVISEEKCTGCGLCVHGCPYGAIYLDRERSIAGKCSFCVGRIDETLSLLACSTVSAEHSSLFLKRS